MEFNEFYESLEYVDIEGSNEMRITEIADKIREHIRENGFNCLDENYDEEEEAKAWIEENHPEWNTSDWEWGGVLFKDREFLCLDDCDEPYFGEIGISFYGDYEKGIGVFNVETD